MFTTLTEDRKVIERKYHNPDAPFDPYNRMAYHGYDYDPSTGLDDEEIKAGLVTLAQETAGQPHPVAKARAIAYVLAHTRIDVNEHDYFVGLYTWNRVIRGITFDQWYRERFEKLPETDAKMKLYNASGAITIGPDFDHVVPDWNAIMALGFPGLLQRAQKYRKAREEAQGGLTEEQAAFFDGIEIEYTAIIEFIDRLYQYAQTRTHEKAPIVARCLKSLRDGAPTNIYEAMQLIYLYFMISESVDLYQVRSLGHGLDATLYPFYRRDLENGTFTRDEIREYLGYFFMQWSAIGNYWGQPFYMGGTNKDGSCKINDLSWNILAVYDELGIYNPKIQIKVDVNTPKDFLRQVFTMIRNGHSSIVFCCEPGFTRAVMLYGATYEEARTMDIRGCYETGIRAAEVHASAGYINALKPVVYAFSNGYDSAAKQQIGVETGDVTKMQTFEEFYAAVLKQWAHLIEDDIAMANTFEPYLGEINPSSMYSATIVSSLEKAVDGYQCGTKYNNSGLLNCGLASLVDAVMAVKELVFEKGETTLAELKKALDSNWEGYELLRAKAQNCTHKYGNGDPETDAYASALSTWFCSRINNRPNARGGVYKTNLHSAMQFVWQGAKTEATPDGRKFGDEISKNGSPSVGMDRNGVTALIQSFTALHPDVSYTTGSCLDVMLHPSAVEGEEGLDVMDALVRTFMQQGGLSIQFNVFNAETLRDAQVHPEKYKNLQVRVCGWNVLWNNLSRKEQNAYILRAENIA